MSEELIAEIGIIGGTGVYDPGMIKNLKKIKVHTPFGRTSDLITIGEFNDRNVAFIPRHGPNHEIPPHKVNSRANIWALKELGVTRIIAPSAVGSLREDYKPSDLVIADQIIDRTKGRADTYYEEGQVCHISLADPFCDELREIFISGAEKLNLDYHKRGTYVCIQGPRFSTKAESNMFRLWGADIIGMTVYPECTLARELELCYATVTTITDYDVWAEKPVSAEEVIETMRKNIDKLRNLISNVITNIPKAHHCSCGEALRDAML
jgi:5'-methylthioadenosine phosphorylase